MQAHLKGGMLFMDMLVRNWHHKLHKRREALGLSRKELGDAIGVSDVAIGQWETGRTKNMTMPHILALEDALNIRLRWLVEDKGPMEAYPSMQAYQNALSRRDEANNQQQKKAWERIAAVFAKAAMVLMFTIPPYMVPQAEARFNIKTDYTMYNRRRKVLSPCAI